MLIREVMKAAELITEKTRDMEKMMGQSVDWLASQFPRAEEQKNAFICASHVLAHREDYDADWTPLEVDEGFVQSLGGSDCVNRDGAHLMIKNGGDALHVVWVRRPMNDEPQLQVVLNGAYSRKVWTRPQLRALIEAMGR